MGYFTNIFGDRESEKFADSWLKTYRANYFKSISQYPNYPTVFHLFSMWHIYFHPMRERKPHLYALEVRKLVSCIHACIPHPECSDALALCMLSIEQPQVVAKHPQYEIAYGHYMSEVFNLMQEDDFDALNTIYDRLNPGTKEKSPFPIGGKELWQSSKEAILILRKTGESKR